MISSCKPAQFSLSSNKKFNGTNWTKFKNTILAAVMSKGMLPYIDGSLLQPLPLVTTTPLILTTYWGSQNPSQEEWDQHNPYVQGLIILNVKNPVGHSVKTDGTALEKWKSLTDHFDTITDLGLMDAKNRLHAIKYTDGGDLDVHFTALHIVWEKVNNQG
jgi:gag-polypeptide of LTR copia-type